MRSFTFVKPRAFRVFLQIVSWVMNSYVGLGIDAGGLEQPLAPPCS